MQEHTSIAKSMQEHTSIAKSGQEHTSIAISIDDPFVQPSCQSYQRQCASVFPYYYSQIFHSLIYLQPFAIFPSPHLPHLRYTFSIVHSPSFPLLSGHHLWPGLHHKSHRHNSTFSTSSSLHFPFFRPPSKPGLHQENHSHNSSFSQLFFPFLFQCHLCHLFRPRLHL